MTPNPTDLRRAKAMAFANWGLIYSGTPEAGIEYIWHRQLKGIERDMWLRHARAIRASDEAAGMVMVPMDATDVMVRAAMKAVTGWRNPIAMRSAINAAMIAAHEGGDA